MRYIKILLMLNITLLVTGCSFIVSRVVPVNDIQSPSGSYKVGTQFFIGPITIVMSGSQKLMEIKRASCSGLVSI